jgi:hypothetical protein
MFMVGIQMALPAARLKRWPLALAALTAGVSLLSNMAIGFAVALLVAWVVRRRGAAL